MLQAKRTALRALGGLVLSVTLALSSAWAGPMDMGGQFSVSGSGAATYSIPIQVPPGIAGMEPKLALSYNSQTGNGLLGMGWSLSGLSAITRCAQTIAQDNAKGEVKFDANDRFCLDGQRLMVIGGADYGALNAQYRTERESFSKIVSIGGSAGNPASFEVRTKAGQIIEYGLTDNSRIEAVKVPGTTVTWPTTTVRLWAINKISDTKGNYLSFSYTEDNANGDYRPTQIDYTGNAGASLAPANSVQFQYDTRTDVSLAFLAGSGIKNSQRLLSISTHQGSTVVKSYRFTYSYGQATTRSRINSIAECLSDGITCLPAKTLAWQDGGTPISNLAQIISDGYLGIGWNSGSHRPVLADFNGDGRTDIFLQATSPSVSSYVLLADATGRWTTISQTVSDGYLGFAWDTGSHRIVLGDFNGDGRTDLFVYALSPSSNSYVLLADESGRFTAVNQIISDGHLGRSWNANERQAVVGDFNGDGRSDLFLQGTAAAIPSLVVLSDGSGRFTTVNQTISDGYLGWAWDATVRNPVVVDLNSDGRSDLILQGTAAGISGLIVLADQSGSFSAVNQTISDGYLGWAWDATVRRIAVGDFNGDGQSDLFLQGTTAGISSLVVLSDGSGRLNAVNQILSDGYLDRAWDAGARQIVVGDFNGDGRSDLFLQGRAASTPSMVVLADGLGRFTTVNQLINDGYLNYGWEAQAHPIFAGDFNGDGRADLFLQNYDAASAAFITLSNNPLPVPDLLASVSGGMGVITAFTYKPLTDISVYSKDSGANAASSPRFDLQMPMYVAASVVSSNAVGGTHTTNYKYGGLKAELGSGRGLLGFRWLEATQAETGLTTRTEHRQDWPYVGLPSQIKKTVTGAAGPSNQVSLVSNTYECTNPPASTAPCVVAPGNRYFPYVKQSVESGWDFNGAVLPTVTTDNQFDEFGNATEVKVSTSDGFSKTTTNTYTNDTANWYLGRLIRSTVQSVTP